MAFVESTPDREAVKGALAITIAVFVGLTSLLAAVMAVGIAPLHEATTGIAGDGRTPNSTGRTLTYVVAVLSVVNAVFAFRSGRKRLNAAIFAAVVLALLLTALGISFVKTW